MKSATVEAAERELLAAHAELANARDQSAVINRVMAIARDIRDEKERKEIAAFNRVNDASTKLKEAWAAQHTEAQC